MKSDVASILQLTDRRGRIVIGLYGLCTTLVAIFNLSGLHHPIGGIIALVLMWAALVILATPGVFGMRSSLGVIGLIIGMTLVSTFNIAVTSPGYATWHEGAITFLMLVLALRGRPGLAWIGFSAFAALEFMGTLILDQGLLNTVNDMARQAATLFVGTLFALFLRRASRTITAIQRTQLSRAAAEAARFASIQERELQVARLERDARPALDRILSSEPLSDEELLGFVVLESSLRDGIRAAGFRGEALAEETRRARERGIQVVLLDDRGGSLEDGERDAVEIALIEQLRSTSEGTITARLSPNDREELATIVVDDNGRYRRVVVTAEGVEITQLS